MSKTAKDPYGLNLIPYERYILSKTGFDPETNTIDDLHLQIAKWYLERANRYGYRAERYMNRVGKKNEKQLSNDERRTYFNLLIRKRESYSSYINWYIKFNSWKRNTGHKPVSTFHTISVTLETIQVFLAEQHADLMRLPLVQIDFHESLEADRQRHVEELEEQRIANQRQRDKEREERRNHDEIIEQRVRAINWLLAVLGLIIGGFSLFTWFFPSPQDFSKFFQERPKVELFYGSS